MWLLRNEKASTCYGALPSTRWMEGVSSPHMSISPMARSHIGSCTHHLLPQILLLMSLFRGDDTRGHSDGRAPNSLLGPCGRNEVMSGMGTKPAPGWLGDGYSLGSWHQGGSDSGFCAVLLPGTWELVPSFELFICINEIPSQSSFI